MAGNRTKLSLPGDLEVVYRYDAQGRLVGLRDWDGQSTDLMYDGVGRHIATARPNGLLTQYRHDAAGRLRRLRHMIGGQVRTQFVYDVDGRGNRIQAYEYLAEPTSVVATYDKDHANVSYPQGSWTDSGSFKKSTHFGAEAAVEFTGDEIALTFGVGPDHSIFDVYIGESLWRSYDGYAESSGERTVHIHLTESGAYTLEIRNRPEKNLSATPGDTYRVQFRQLQVLNTEYTAQTILYTYDRLARLLLADTYAGTDLEATPTREYAYAYDRAGNRLSQALALNGGQPTTTTYTYNVANQLVNDGTNTLTYDDNGNLTSDGVSSFTWDRANRLLSMGGVSNQYDGAGHRIQKTVGVDVTKYLLDLQPGLSVALSANKNGDITRFVHTPMGVHAQEDPNGMWTWAVQDGLGSVRLEANHALSVLGMRHLDPFGNPFGVQGTMTLPFVFTGEVRDENGLQDHRARQYSSQLGIFPSLDPFEGMMEYPMSLNRYGYALHNPINLVDPTGLYVYYDIPSPSPCSHLLDIGSQTPESYDEYVQCLINHGMRDRVCPRGYTYLSLAETGTALTFEVPPYREPYCRYNGNGKVDRAYVAVRDAYGKRPDPMPPSFLGLRVETWQSIYEFWNYHFVNSSWSDFVRAHPIESIALGVGAGWLTILGGYSVFAGASFVEGLPLWMKLAALGGGTGYVAETTSQAINNMNQCGMDVWNAFYHENLDAGKILRSTVSGVLTGLVPSVWRFWGALGGWGLTGLGTQSVVTGLLSSLGYVVGLVTANQQKGKPPFEGLDAFSASSNLFFGSVYGGFWGVGGKTNPAQTFSEAAIPMAVLGLVASFIQTGFNTAFNFEDTTPEGLALGVGSGLGNIYSASDLPIGYAAVLFLTAFFTQLSEQSAE